MNDEFYIGWEDRAPAAYRTATRWFVVCSLTLVALAGLVFALAQRQIGVAFFEWGEVREFHGVLHADPYPHVTLAASEAPSMGAAREPRRPAGVVGPDTIAAPLVAPFKFGLKRADVTRFDGREVLLQATRIHRDGQLMLEVVPGSIREAGAAASPSEGRAVVASSGAATVSLGRATFRGEIVDSKCWMGVMNPGVLAPHRACAVRCISGGIPPMLLVRRENAPPLNLLLVSPEGRPVNEAVLGFVAEPVEVTGEVVRQGSLLLLRTDTQTIRRL